MPLPTIFSHYSSHGGSTPTDFQLPDGVSHQKGGDCGIELLWLINVQPMTRRLQCF